ncbi:MAG: hypothetical protein RBS05_12515 [Zoogloea oleivorans]|nr:hypothetical protein [Zoogloea oleivorans]
MRGLMAVLPAFIGNFFQQADIDAIQGVAVAVITRFIARFVSALRIERGVIGIAAVFVFRPCFAVFLIVFCRRIFGQLTPNAIQISIKIVHQSVLRHEKTRAWRALY